MTITIPKKNLMTILSFGWAASTLGEIHVSRRLTVPTCSNCFISIWEDHWLPHFSAFFQLQALQPCWDYQYLNHHDQHVHHDHNHFHGATESVDSWRQVRFRPNSSFANSISVFYKPALKNSSFCVSKIGHGSLNPGMMLFSWLRCVCGLKPEKQKLWWSRGENDQSQFGTIGWHHFFRVLRCLKLKSHRISAKVLQMHW